MISGLARAARRLQRDDWLNLALQALDALKSRRWRDGASQHPPTGQLLATDQLPGYLDDYAHLLAAVLDCLQARFRPADLAFAQALAEALLAQFEDTANGGFFFTAHSHETLIQRPKPLHDNPLPAGNAVAAQALLRLGHLLGETRYLDAAQRSLAVFQAPLERHPAGAASLAGALETALMPLTSVILRGPAAALTTWQAQLASEASRAFILAVPNEIEMQHLHPALAKPATDHVNAWVCRGVNCLVPVEKLADLQATLRQVLQAG